MAGRLLGDPLRDTERWFIRRGLPQFVESYDSDTDVWTRAQPFLLVILALELSPWLLVALIPGGTFGPLVAVAAVLVVLAAFGAWSKWRRGYWFAPAHRVGWPFLVAFVAAPVLAQAVVVDFTFDLEATSGIARLTNSWGDVAGTLVTQALVLAVVYLVVRYAVIAMTVWAVRQTARHARDLYTVSTKALPFLLIVMIVLFVNTEMWQVAGSLEAGVLWASVGLLLLLGVLVTFDRTRAQIASLEFHADAAAVRDSCRGTPMEDESLAVPVAAAVRPLRRRQRGNLVVAAMAMQAIQAAVIGGVVWAFFMVFGLIAITEPVQLTWLGGLAPDDVFWRLGEVHVVSRALFRVATFMGGFAAFYTTVYAATDDTYKASFATDVGAELQRAVNVQRVYVAARAAQPA